MAPTAPNRYRESMAKAYEYHQQALWQEKLRSLQEALAICDEADLPNADACKQEVLYEVGGIRRRLGQYDLAEQLLHQSLEAFPAANLLKRANILGELGVVLRSSNRLAEAREVNREQYQLARDAAPSLEAEMEMCRAIGNEGMAALNLSQLSSPVDAALLAAATAQVQERVWRARKLQRDILAADALPPKDRRRHLEMARTWETIGLDRLTLCNIAAGDARAAVRSARESQEKQRGVEPTLTAYSKFIYGYALWSDGRREDALRQWNVEPGTCSPPMALCKEPTAEHMGWVKLMAHAGVNFDSYDEQGYGALDYAALSSAAEAQEMMTIILDALRKALSRDIGRQFPGISANEVERKLDDEIDRRMHQAQLRRQYRTILQEHIRPELRAKSVDLFPRLRGVYSKFLSDSPTGQAMFSGFQYVRYIDFAKHGKLPISSAGLTKHVTSNDLTAASIPSDQDDFVIFLSYRWIGGMAPDDADHRQWYRIMNAIEKFLLAHGHVRPERLGLWLDYACIDQEYAPEMQRGVDTLPLAVTLCNAMISIVDQHYYERAWCSVEVMLMRVLIQSYGLHYWWEHVLDSPDVSRTNGSLRKGDLNRIQDVSQLKLTKEILDRPKIDFLVRQSKLLGSDNS